MPQERKTVFVGPNEVASFNRNLCEGLRELGVDYEFVTFSRHRFNYGGETHKPLLLKMANYIASLRESKNWIKSFRSNLRFLEVILQSCWGVIAIFKYDIFFFSFGQSLLPLNIDLLILRVLRKTTISNIGFGSECRPPYIDGARMSFAGKQPDASKLYALAKRNKKLVSRHQKYSAYVIGAPFSSSHYSEKPFVNWFSIGFPSHIEEYECCENEGPVLTSSDDRPVRILHSPSHPAMKGSSRITNVINELKDEGHSIEFVLVHGRPFEDVLREIKKCDFVVDQLFSDTPMAGFAREAAWFGKPAVVAGFGFERLKKLLNESDWPPSETCHPNSLKSSIEKLLTDSKFRHRLGESARVFVRTKWHARSVAARYLKLARGDIPRRWWFDPHLVCYLEGIGQAKEQSQQQIAKLIDCYGLSALNLEHRPDLEKAFYDFAQG